MPFGEILYNIAIFLFAFMTFLIVRNYFRSKFDDEGRRKDMLDEYEEKDSPDESPKD